MSLGADAGPFPTPIHFASTSGATPIPIEPGLITLRESVNATWELAGP